MPDFSSKLPQFSPFQVNSFGRWSHKLTPMNEFYQIKYIKMYEYDMKIHTKTTPNLGSSKYCKLN